MKKFNALTRIQFFLLSMFASVMAFAQEAADDLNVDVNVDDATAGGDWMSNPLVWVIGALVLILIIALVARGGGSRD